MKEFLKTKTVTYNLMSFTGFKALFLFSLLAESPKSYKEINEHFANHPYLKEEISIDTLRVYINSLERIGCKIERTKKSEGSKYVLLNSPFELKITDEQINSVAKVYKSISKNNCDVAIAPLYRIVDKGYTIHCNLPFNVDVPYDINKYLEIMYTPGYYNCAIWNKLYKASIVKAHPLGILKYEDWYENKLML